MFREISELFSSHQKQAVVLSIASAQESDTFLPPYLSSPASSPNKIILEKNQELAILQKS